jgi:hypothetical protein
MKGVNVNEGVMYSNDLISFVKPGLEKINGHAI